MIYHHIEALVEKAVETELIMETDWIYARNQVLGELKLTDFPEDVSADVYGNGMLNRGAGKVSNQTDQSISACVAGYQTNKSIPDGSGDNQTDKSNLSEEATADNQTESLISNGTAGTQTDSLTSNGTAGTQTDSLTSDGTAGIQNKSIPDILDAIIHYAVEQTIIPDALDAKEMLSANIMNCFVARPSVINQTFDEKYNTSPQAATDYFYALSRNSNYIQTKRIEKNIHYQADTQYGKLDITINLSKPEKDPEQIKRERKMKQAVRYPKCPLCVENEGYPGRVDHPARANHRIIHIPLNGEDWYFQYSPYVYYNEHSIVLSRDHRDMKINRKGFERLLTFTEQFPHYFIGSNADLPIVGGSILTHDHYQSGRYEFAMMRAEAKYTFQMEGYPKVHASVLEWPLSVIQLKSTSKTDILQAADNVLLTWKQYSDPNAAIHAYTDDVPHNTITPIARKQGDTFILDLVLRNNRTSEAHPMGIFHPHHNVQHIKKENIGLIEVMGLAVLPARLKDELKNIERLLLGEQHSVANYHYNWAMELKATYGTVPSEKVANDILRKELGYKFMTVLEHAGVFKHEQSWRRFTNTLT